MALRVSTAYQKKIADGGTTGGWGPPWGTTGRIETRTGAQPATADTAPSGTLLSTNSMNATAGYGGSDTPAAGATTGTTIAMAAVSSATAVASGTAAHVRQKLSGDAGTLNNTDVRMDYDLTATGGGGTAILDNTAIVSGGTVNVTAGSLVIPYQ